MQIDWPQVIKTENADANGVVTLDNDCAKACEESGWDFDAGG